MLYAAGAGPSGVILFRQSATGQWNFRNLTTEVGGVTAPGGKLVLLVGADSLVRLAGLSQGGKLVLYAQNGAGAAGAYNWTYTDLATHDLEAQGQVMPAFVGEITGYVTSWNGLNVAGIDASGDIHTVWWAPGMNLWETANLSDVTRRSPRSPAG